MKLFKNDPLSLLSILVGFGLASHGLNAESNNAFLPAIYSLLDKQSHLERVLSEYENPNSTHIFIAAHRGGKNNDVLEQTPGNSIKNIQNAVSKGYDIYESDIEILGDDTLVVFHDNDFNSLTNTTETEPDLLDDADWDYAKSLLLTYENGSVSSEAIPRLDVFLAAGKDQIMFKFDLKSGVSGEILIILDLIQGLKMQRQVLIRGGNYLLSTAKANGYDTKTIMRKFDSASTSAADITALINNYDVRAISLPNGAPQATINAARDAGLIVEIHESQDANAREASWDAAISNGYRQIHSFKPSLLKPYLQNLNRHW